MKPFIGAIGLALAVPLAIWLASYIHLAHYHRRANLFPVLIHESGRHTLTGTIFYFNHFLRELPIDTLYILCIYWVYRVIGVMAGVIPTTSQPLAITLLLAFLTAVVLGSVIKVGLKNTLLDLTQARELDTVVAHGSHWQMHFFSTAALMLLLMLPGSLLPFANGILLAIVWGVFTLLSALFGVGRKALTDPRWLLHGAREIFTYGLLYGVLAYLPLFASKINQPLRLTGLAILAAACLMLMAGYLAWVYRNSDLKGLAQGSYGAVYLITSHFFEHVLDVIYLVLMMNFLLSM